MEVTQYKGPRIRYPQGEAAVGPPQMLCVVSVNVGLAHHRNRDAL